MFDSSFNYVGFSEDFEFLPKNFDTFNSEYKLRYMFLSLCSKILDESPIFSDYEKKKLSKLPLKKIFQQKIKSLLPLTSTAPQKSFKSFKVDAISTAIINNYLHNEHKKIFIADDSKLLLVAKVINRCYCNNNFQLLFERDLLFHHFVLQKIVNLHSDKKVIDEGDSISLLPDNGYPIKIFTSWKMLDSKNLNISSDIQRAIKYIKKSKQRMVYLVYPKNDNFKKHIPVITNQLKKDYIIKAIPYSLRSTLKN